MSAPTKLTNKKPFKKLIFGSVKSGGRNNLGRITSYHKGGGHKRSYRLIDFKRDIYDIPAIVIRLEYDPNRSAYIALICYKNGIFSYILAPKGLKEGDIVLNTTRQLLSIGNSIPLYNIPIGTLVHNVQIKTGKPGQLLRSAGVSGKVVSHSVNGFITILLASGQKYQISEQCFATIGTVSNENHYLRNLGKAGRSRWLNKRPTVRGVAMNPVDHPHGGGEGKSKSGRVSVTPWGIYTKGQPTRKRKFKKRNG